MKGRTTRLVMVLALVLLALPLLGALTPPEQGAHTARYASQRLIPPDASPPLALAQEEESQDPEANLPFLFAVYTITWVAFFAYAFYMSRRQADLRREIEAIRQELEERDHRADQ